MSGFWRVDDISFSEESSEHEHETVENRERSGKAVVEISVPDGSRSVAVKSKQMEVAGKAASKWLSGSWPLQPFDENLPLNKRKAEWIRFRNQFERIVACKEPVEPAMQLSGLKIFAGNYLLSVIEIQENLLTGSDDVYKATVLALNRYFDQTCDYTKERMKFREMRMDIAEPFVDWVLRLENQAKFCEFESEQRKEEFTQALIRRSVPEIATKLYEMSDVFNNDLERIMAHGRHLDYIRLETNEGKQAGKVETSNSADDAYEGQVVKPVNAVFGQNSESGPMRRVTHREARSEVDGRVFTKNNRFRGVGHRGRAGRYNPTSWNCSSCGKIHGPKECRAYRVKCYACGREGHFAEFCFSRNKGANQSQRGRSDRGDAVKAEAGKINQLITGSTNFPQGYVDPRFVSCKIGTEYFKFLVDTGATVNTITTSEWQIIKRKCRSVIQDVAFYPEEILRSYATHRPLEVECSFKAYIGVNGQPLQLEKFFVVKSTDLSLLSYETARKLNLVHVGLQDTANVHSIGVGKMLCSISDTRLEPKMLDIAVAHENEPMEFPKIPIAAVKFKVDDSVTPKQIIRYSIPKAFESATNERLRLMEERGIIERADKEHDIITCVSPLVLVPKGTSDFRIVVDYREVNKAIIREPYPMPSLDKIWTDIPNGTMYFSKLDLKDAYFHIELDEEVRHFTTFMTANGLMRFRRLPFGLSCAPELFQRVMERLLMKCKNIIIYLDDILLFGRNLRELRYHVAEVKRVLRENNLSVNEDKSMYDQSTVDFLGFTIDGSGILPMQKKISDIKLFAKPKDTSEVRSFLGILTYISPFIRNFSHKTKLLRELLTENTKFEWTVKHQEAFEKLKDEVENDLIKRGFFNEKDRTILYTDASPWGLGAILAQEQEETGERRIIACASKSLTAAECRYPQLHREALAIIWAMEKFAYYLLGRRFTLRSDNEALLFMTKNGNRKDVGKRILSRAEGWMLRMDHFNYDFEHVAGKDNVAGAASRIGAKRDNPQFGMEKEPHELFSVTASTSIINDQLLALTNADVKKELLNDEELQTVIEWLDKKERWPVHIAKYQAFQGELYMQGQLLMKREKMVLPSTLRERALRLAHRSHPGMSTMKNFLRQGLWWPGMDRETEEFVKSCPECQLVTVTSRPVPIEMTELPQNPWDYVSMDFASASDVLNWKALVLTDNYSRFLVAVPLDKTDTEAVKRTLKKVFNTYYIPKTLKADNGPPFNSMELKSWLNNIWGVRLIHSTPLNPTENGLVERSMQGINKITAIAKLGKLNWKEALSDYVAAYNSWPHHVTKIPPAELMFGRTVRSVLPNLRTDQLQSFDEELRDRDQKAKFNRNLREDTARGARHTEIEVGDTVLVTQQKRDKADTPYKNAFHKVIKIQGAGRATITDLSADRTYDRNVKFLKKYVERKPTDSCDNVPLEEKQPEPTQHLDSRDRRPASPPVKDATKRSSGSGLPDDGEPIAKRRNIRQIRKPQRFLNTIEQTDE